MSSTSPNFKLVLATTSDQVDVVAQVANNFSTLDTVLSVSLTGTGQLKSGLTLTNPVVVNPTFSGTGSGAVLFIANTGRFNTITATGGALTLNTLSLGTYSFPTTIGSTSYLLTVVTGNAQWAASSPNTGANQGLNNLAGPVAINTSLNTFTAGLITADRVIASSGSLTGLTVFQATTGTFAGNLSVTGTLTANAINCTGGAGTFGTVTVGTWALPATIGASTSVFRVSGSTASFILPTMTIQTAFSVFGAGQGTNINTASAVPITFVSTAYDSGSNVSNGLFTAPTSGLYDFNFGFSIQRNQSGLSTLSAGIVIATTQYSLYTTNFGGTSALGTGISIFGSLINTVTSGATVSVFAKIDQATTGACVVSTTAGLQGYFTGKRLFEF